MQVEKKSERKFLRAIAMVLLAVFTAVMVVACSREECASAYWDLSKERQRLYILMDKVENTYNERSQSEAAYIRWLEAVAEEENLALYVNTGVSMWESECSQYINDPDFTGSGYNEQGNLEQDGPVRWFGKLFKTDRDVYELRLERI